jgi:hypothetical protein
MTTQVKVADPVYEQAVEVSNERDISIKAAISLMCREGGYEV